ncbi:epoxyqueuosine reductase [Anaeromicrobium sediminis]|uniref:(Fe-S)-binding protein n=1 Tax=Anaeromicrobium sediminis TaxID=1478221 RepID=A0A267MJF2_9FIRM|nr:epoxyqueuosine reductase [Anaeromicrobium sediminis]PAB58995.1 (Fe-S)-binding protein [Anaeromicrobium sediminis]
MKNIVESMIKSFVKEYEKNTYTKWEEPIFAYGDSKDPLFESLKTIVGPNHKVPQDFLVDAKTVISYFIPFKRHMVKTNEGNRLSSYEWAKAYVETNELIYEINKMISKRLKKYKYEAILLPNTLNFDEENLISDWSQRHVAYICGLGKFGLHNLLITQKGCCGRIGTIITNLNIEKTNREDGEYCLYRHNGSCKVCVKKCVNDALGEEVFYRHKCHEICLENIEYHRNIGYTDICGKCSTMVPCSFNIPVK